RHGPVAQLVSASPCHGEGRGFESRQGRNGVPVVDRRPGQVAQLVERPPETRKVAGSTPALATSRRIVPASVGAIFFVPRSGRGWCRRQSQEGLSSSGRIVSSGGRSSWRPFEIPVVERCPNR